jgi:PIN domain nuclease of toxin-antitoxin system
MRLLPDTHVVLWWLADDPTLPLNIREHLDSDPEVYLSAASVWEIAIKQALGKIQPPEVAERVQASGFRPLPITSDHAIAAGRLPAIHNDPFDRMLIAQALVEDLTLITRDAMIQKYEIATMVV